MAHSAYMTLYKVVMNINEDSRRPHGWQGLEGDRCIKRDTPTDKRRQVPTLLITNIFSDEFGELCENI